MHALTCLLVERRLAIGMPYGKALDHPAVSHQDRRRAARGQRHCRCDAECMTAADDGGKEQNAHRGRRFAHSPSSITPRGCSSVPLGAHGRSKRKRGTAGIDLDHGQRCSRPWASNSAFARFYPHRAAMALLALKRRCAGRSLRGDAQRARPARRRGLQQRLSWALGADERAAAATQG